MDFKNYQSQIKELIALRNQPDFNDLLNKILFGESSSDKFLIKMELNRLAKPSRRIIDLRDSMPLKECQVYQHGNMKHYLTASAINVLQNNIKLYGQYTEGVVEAVYLHLAQQKEKQKNQQINTQPEESRNQCELLQLAQQNKRAAARMFFVSEVQLFTADGKILRAHTSDISASGIKIKLLEYIDLYEQESLKVNFQGLQKEYHEPLLAEQIRYNIVKQTDEGDAHYLYLMYADQKDKFTVFLSEFIKSNRYKYKIDASYYYQLAKVRSLKNIYIAQMHTLPIYLNSSAPSPFLFALKNSANKQIINEFSCNGINQFPLLFNELRLTKLLAYARKNTISTLYCFTHSSKDKEYFLSATEDELQEKGLKGLFIGYGSTKPSWRIYHLTINECQYQENRSYSICESMPEEFLQTSHIATLQPLAAPLPFTVNQAINKKDLNQINQFIHRATAPQEAPVFTLFSKEQRKEPRYLYRSQIMLTSEDNKYSGEILDFSCSGLKIKLEQLAILPPESEITINLFELQKISSAFAISSLHYKVVRTTTPRTLHLQVSNIKTLDICTQFFSLLVKNNPNHFEQLPLIANKQPSSARLNEMSENAFINCIFFVGKEGGRAKIKIAAIDNTTHPLHKLFAMGCDNKTELNYYPLINNNLYERLIALPFKNDPPGKIYKEALIYVKAYQYAKKKWLINSFLSSDFKTEQEKIHFIKQSQEEGHFYALHYRLSSIEDDKLNSIQAEIRAISRVAGHLKKKLEAELNDINAMIEVTDRTAAILQALPNSK